MQRTRCLQASLRAVIKSIGITGHPQLSHHCPLSLLGGNSAARCQRKTTPHARTPRGIATSGAKQESLDHGSVLVTSRDQTDSDYTENGSLELSSHDENSPRFRPGLQADGTITPEYRRALERSHARSKTILLKRAQIYVNKRSQNAGHIPGSIRHMLKDVEIEGINPYVPRLEVVRLPPHKRACFTGDAHEALLEIMQRTGSHARVVSDEQHPTDTTTTKRRPRSFQSLTLWGTPAQNAKAIELLPQLTRDFSSATTELSNLDSLHFQKDTFVENISNSGSITPSLKSTASSSEHNDMIQLTWSNRPSIAQPIDETLNLRPTKWSTVDFARYIRALTRFRNWQVRAKGTLRGVERVSATDRVVAEIRHLIVDRPDLLKFASSEAVDHILDFLSQHFRTQDMKDVVSSLDSSSAYDMTASNHDTLLVAAATQGDLYNFAQSLRIMTRKGIRPTWKTWVALHRLAVNSPSRQLLHQVFRAINRRGVLANIQATKAVAADGMRIEIRRHLRKGGTIDSFLAHYDRRFSPEKLDRAALGNTPLTKRPWLSNEAVAFMIEELLSLGRHQDALSIVTQFTDQGSVNHWRIVRGMLVAALRANNTDAAVATINHFRVSTEPSRSKLNAQIFDLLFKLAWRTRSWNMSRVIWRYACLSSRLRWKNHLVARQSMTLYPLPEEIELWLTNGQNHQVAPRLSSRDELTSELDLVLGNQTQVSQMEPIDSQQTVLSEAELFKRWIGKFIAGVVDGNSASLELMPTDQLSTQSSRLLVIGTTRRFLEETEHKQRREDGLAILYGDTLTWETHTPLEPFYKKLDEAWRKDQQWKSTELTTDSGLSELTLQHIGQIPSEERANEVFASLRRLLQWMMLEGVRVPVEPIRAGHASNT